MTVAVKQSTALTPRRLVSGTIPGTLSIWVECPDARIAAEMLTTWAGLRRLAPDDPLPCEDALEVVIRTQTERLLRTINRSPFDLNRWEARLSDIAEAQAEGDNDFALSLADDRFAELDNAGLLAWAISSLSKEPMTDRDILRQAHAIFGKRIDLFLGLAEEAAEVLSASRVALDQTDADLADTLLPHGRLVAAVETLTQSANPLALVRVIEASRPLILKPKSRIWQRIFESQPVMAADTANPRGVVTLRFREPTGKYHATLVIDLAAKQKCWTLTFHLGREPAKILTGEPIEFAGVPTAINAEGIAKLPRDQFHFDLDPVLMVGTAKEIWPLTT